MSNQIKGFITGIILGGVIGAAVGILFAPQSGLKTRKDINRKTKRLIAKSQKEYEAALKKGGKAYESAVRQLKHLESSAKEKIGEMEEKVDELTEIGKDAFQDTKSHLIKAVNATANAFK
ncbi:MAG: YtxH domain-containing protein [Deltaproteobacteria bacterium]|nr:YtxH domain-containing protein [Deltaproteobacteria bacterium]